MKARILLDEFRKLTAVPPDGTCSYCCKPLTPIHTFSYGISGAPRVFGCNRWWCRHVTRKIRIRLIFVRYYPMTQRIGTKTRRLNLMMPTVGVILEFWPQPRKTFAA